MVKPPVSCRFTWHRPCAKLEPLTEIVIDWPAVALKAKFAFCPGAVVVIVTGSFNVSTVVAMSFTVYKLTVAEPISWLSGSMKRK